MRAAQALCAVTVMEEARWETCICHWHIVKDCGLACCCQACLGLPCILGAAMERAGLGGCFPWCSAGCCCPCCTGCNARAQVAKKYDIGEGAPMSCIYACCCPFFSEIQIINQVHVPMPNHLKPFDVCFQMSLSGPSWPTLFTALPHPRPLCSQNGFSEMPTDSNQRARYVELLRGERRFGDRRA